MSMIPDEIVEQVRDGADLVGIIGESVELRAIVDVATDALPFGSVAFMDGDTTLGTAGVIVGCNGVVARLVEGPTMRSTTDWARGSMYSGIVAIAVVNGTSTIIGNEAFSRAFASD